MRTEDGTVVPKPKFEYLEEKSMKAAYGEKPEKNETEESAKEEHPSEENNTGIDILAKLLYNPETASLLKALAKNL